MNTEYGVLRKMPAGVTLEFMFQLAKDVDDIDKTMNDILRAITSALDWAATYDIRSTGRRWDITVRCKEGVVDSGSWKWIRIRKLISDALLGLNIEIL